MLNLLFLKRYKVTVPKSVSLFLLLLLGTSLNAKEIKYRVSDIPQELMNNADAVIRNYELDFELKSIESATMKVTYAITILNNNAIEKSYFMEYYDRFSKINHISGKIYQENGELLRKIPNDKIVDYSAISKYTVYNDNRVKYIDPETRTIPFTVEYTYEKDLKGLLFLPVWIPNYDFDISVEKSRFTVSVPFDLSFRYYEQNIHSTVYIVNTPDYKTYTWKAEKLKAIESEPYCLPFGEYAAIVYTAPNDFSFDKYNGNAETWLDFGLWVNKLNSGKEKLPVETINLIQDMVKDIAEDEEKVKIVYQYLQDNTRYVSIQVGIGGWQPFEAEIVDKLKYGDCKALTNYMKALLNAAGIRSFYTLVNAGKDASRMFTKFPSSQFNHAFLCVPLENDTMWLECTSQHLPCGFLGTFTDDRNVLLITEDGGKVTHTPTYTSGNNKQIRTAKVTLTDDGYGSATLSNKYHGIYYNDLLPILYNDEHDRKKLMYQRINIPSYHLIHFKHNQIRERIPCVEETIEVQLMNYTTSMGNHILIPLNLQTKSEPLPRKREQRLSDIFVRRDYIEIDTVIYTIPENYSIEGLPEDNKFTSDFGEYSSKVYSDGSQIWYYRFLKINKGTYHKNRYQEFCNFFDKISVCDNVKAVLVNN